jgi:hypothetical protein
MDGPGLTPAPTVVLTPMTTTGQTAHAAPGSRPCVQPDPLHKWVVAPMVVTGDIDHG